MFIKDRLFASLNLDDKEMNLYDSIANMMERNVINPDLIIYLQADTSTLMKNIDKRARDFENNISYDYINALNEIYTEYFFRYNDTPLVIINTNNIDFVNNVDDLDQVIEYIRQPVAGTKFFNPSASI
jgi:deoxyadenosine/deoxycytidine kinase